MPWVARWSDEVDLSPFGIVDGRLSYPDPREEDWALGVLWIRETGQRTGVPQFGQVSTLRQRRCLLDRLCQVCGTFIGGPVPWAIPASEAALTKPRGRAFTTSTPPVCEGCLPVALAACPNLSQYPPMVLDVKGYRTWGVFGEIVDERGHRRVEVPLGYDRLRLVLARQLIVEVFDYRRRRTAG